MSTEFEVDHHPGELFKNSIRVGLDDDGNVFIAEEVGKIWMDKSEAREVAERILAELDEEEAPKVQKSKFVLNFPKFNVEAFEKSIAPIVAELNRISKRRA